MNRKVTYQPFIKEKAAEIIDILKDDIKPSEYATERLCTILTQKFIDGKISSTDDISNVFESEDELMCFINMCNTHEDLLHLMELGLVGMIDDEKEENIYYLTEAGKVYVGELSK